MSPAWDGERPPPLELIEECVHCGFCLPTCPSYLVLERETDSPRGRIVLMRAGHDAELSAEMVGHLDACLGCMACVTACPSGVRYDELIERVRPQIERGWRRPLRERALRRAAFALFPHPGRLRALVPLAAAARALGLERAPALGRLLALAPRTPLRSLFERLPVRTPARGELRGRVGLLQGCVQRAFFPEVNAATARVLAAEGFEVHAPRLPRCCGALELHSGEEEAARAAARATIEAFERCPVLVTNAAGCGSACRDYGRLLAGDRAWEERARALSARVRDVTELLAGVEPRAVRHPLALRVAYHDACHLAHAQRVREPPRALLRSIPGVELAEPAGWEVCCGSAGLYNLTHPEIADELGRRKAAALRATGAQVVAAANPGCAMQIAAHLALPVRHPIELLDASIRGPRTGPAAGGRPAS